MVNSFLFVSFLRQDLKQCPWLLPLPLLRVLELQVPTTTSVYNTLGLKPGPWDARNALYQRSHATIC